MKPYDSRRTSTAEIALFPLARVTGFSSPQAHELDFLPAALEIVERPASPLGRGVAAAISAMALIAIVWSCVGKIDIIATANGRIIPSGQIKTIQPFEIGTVKAIHVADGGHVRTGDILIELDTTTNDADEDRIARDLIQAKFDEARLNALLLGNIGQFVSPENADENLKEAAKRELIEALEEHRAKLEGIDHQIAGKQADRNAAKATIAKVVAALPIAQQRVDIYQKLRENEYSSKVSALEAQQALVEAQHDGAIAESQLGAAEATISALTQQRLETEAQFRQQNMDDLSKARQKAAELEQDQVKAVKKIALQSLRASVDGTVEQLAVHTVGGVVTPAQTLMTIVPDSSQLEIEASLPNREVGFVHAGQQAEIKVQAFTYTRYGLLRGKVDGISRNAVSGAEDDKDDKAKSKSQAASDRMGSSDGEQDESHYTARISLLEFGINTEQGRLPLEPGMTVVAEIKTGKRRVISYVLSSILEHDHDSFRER